MSQAAASLSPFAVFKNRSFSLMWSGQLISTIGDALTSLAAGILVYRLTGSALSVGLMLMVTALPTLVLGLIAGVFADRYDRKRIMVGANLIQAGLVFLIPLLIPYSIVWLYVIVAASSAVSQFFLPAHESVLPEVASDEELAAANSMLAISSYGSTAIGYAAAGLLASQFNIAWVFYIDALTFLVSALCLMGIRVEPLEVDEETGVRMVFRNVRVGLEFLFGSTVLRSTLLLGLGIAFSVGLINTLLLPFTLQALGATEFVYGLQEGLTSIGFVVASLLMASLTDRLREGQWLVISLLGMGVANLFYAFSTVVWVAISLSIVAGFFNAPASIAGRLLRQRNTTREVRGRVNSAYFVATDVMVLLGMAAGGLADLVNVRWLFAFAALVTLALGIFAGVLPGLGQPAAEWRRAVSLLRGAKAAPRLGAGRAATPEDFEALGQHIPAFTNLSDADKRNLAARTLVADAKAGTAILKRGDPSDAGYFVIEGRAVAGWDEEGGYRPLETLNAGDFFGEIAALTGVPRTANVIAEEDMRLLQAPAAALRLMSANRELNRLFLTKMTERMVRMRMIDLPTRTGLDGQTLLELRSPSVTPEPA